MVEASQQLPQSVQPPGDAMFIKITRAVLESYLKCPYKAHLKMAGEQGSKSDYELLLGESRDRVRLAGMTSLLARQKDDEVLRGLPLTQAVLKQGVPLLSAS